MEPELSEISETQKDKCHILYLYVEAKNKSEYRMVIIGDSAWWGAGRGMW